MVQWIYFGVLVLSTLLFFYFYVRSAGPAALEVKLGPLAYAVCTRYRIVASVLMIIATTN